VAAHCDRLQAAGSSSLLLTAAAAASSRHLAADAWHAAGDPPPPLAAPRPPDSTNPSDCFAFHTSSYYSVQYPVLYCSTASASALTRLYEYRYY
jgi:hypothetical protein